MVLGFISLILTFGQNYIAKICIPEVVANTMLPCPIDELDNDHPPSKVEGEHHRRLLWNEHRFLAADSPAAGCKEGHVPVISINELHQLHIFIFFLAVFHVIFGAITMTLGRLKTRGWKEWEKETAHIKEVSNVIFLLLNVRGWQIMFWLSTMPLVVAVDIQERHAVVRGIPLLQVSDRHFRFSRPYLILQLIHFTLFQYEFGLHSCFHEDLKLSLTRIAVGYITLPLYALVTQMGSNIKKSFFDEQIKKALTNWTMAAKKKNTAVRPKNQRLGGSPGESPENSPTRHGQSGLEMSSL